MSGLDSWVAPTTVAKRSTVPQHLLPGWQFLRTMFFGPMSPPCRSQAAWPYLAWQQLVCLALLGDANSITLPAAAVAFPARQRPCVASGDFRVSEWDQRRERVGEKR